MSIATIVLRVTSYSTLVSENKQIIKTIRETKAPLIALVTLLHHHVLILFY